MGKVVVTKKFVEPRVEVSKKKVTVVPSTKESKKTNYGKGFPLNERWCPWNMESSSIKH